MKKLIQLLVLFLLIGYVYPVKAQSDICTYLNGSLIINNDNEFIGTIENKFSENSIFNKFGKYGSKFNTESIWNKFGKHGSKFSANSVFDKFSTNPPRLIKNRKIIAYLTVNKNIVGGIHPVVLGVTCFQFEPTDL